MKLYRFSPIHSGAELKDAIRYVAEQEVRLVNKIIGRDLIISYLTIFAHYEDEYERLVTIIGTWAEERKQTMA
jgi:hypothetical protein